MPVYEKAFSSYTLIAKSQSADSVTPIIEHDDFYHNTFWQRKLEIFLFQVKLKEQSIFILRTNWEQKRAMGFILFLKQWVVNFF